MIEISKKTNHKTDQIELVISILCLVEGIHLSKTEITVLSYFVVHGVKDATEDMLIKSGVTKPEALRNIKTRLTKLKFLKRTKELYKSYELGLSKDFKLDDVMKVFIKIDNS